MPKTATPNAAPTTAPADNTPDQPGELIWVDPNALEVDPANKRSDLGDLTGITATVAALGVIQPVVVRPDGERLTLLTGQRRRAAAIAAGRPAIPAILRADLAGLPIGVALALVENDHRKSMTTAERARSYQQMRLDGFSLAKITEITGTKRAEINQAVAVGRSELAVAATERYDLTLEQALALAEFDTDREAVKELVSAAKTRPGQWDHVLRRLRDDRDAKAAHDAAAAHLTAAGIRVIDEDDLPEGARMLAGLLESDDGPSLNPEVHRSCPGHAEAVHPFDPKRTVAYCLDPTGNGHVVSNPSRRSPAGSTTTQPRGECGKLSEEEKAERRRVMEGNKAWRAARQVRQQFLKDLLARRTPAKTTLRFVTETILAHPARVGDGDDTLIADLLRLSSDHRKTGFGRSAGLTAAARATDARLPLILLAQIAADAETALHDHTWRETRPAVAARWLAWLASVGYTLSDIETQVVAAGTPTDPASKSATPNPGAENA